MPESTYPLSTNFTLGEFLRSSTAERDEGLRQEQFNPPSGIVDNLKYLVETTLQPIRSGLRFPIRITSGYRSPLLNKLVGGSATSQHCLGEAADCELSPRFLTDPGAEAIRNDVRSRVHEIVGKPLRPDVNDNFYLFAFICIRLQGLDVDQVIHEYGDGFGYPAWVHVSASRRKDKRQILMVGSYTNRRYIKPTLEEALSYGT